VQVAQLPFDEVLSISPPLWTKEGKQLERQDRRAVPAVEALGLGLDVARQLAGLAKP
jgi:hypothetical protein